MIEGLPTIFGQPIMANVLIIITFFFIFMGFNAGEEGSIFFALLVGFGSCFLASVWSWWIVLPILIMTAVGLICIVVGANPFEFVSEITKFVVYLVGAILGIPLFVVVSVFRIAKSAAKGHVPAIPAIRRRPLFAKSRAKVQPDRLYHGGPNYAVTDIYRNNRFLIGDSKPSALWMTTNFGYASSISSDGTVVELAVDSSIALEQYAANTYIARVPNAKKNVFYTFPGIVPVRILGTNMRQIVP